MTRMHVKLGTVVASRTPTELFPPPSEVFEADVLPLADRVSPVVSFELGLANPAWRGRGVFLFTEDPARGFLPSLGALDVLADETEGRFETGVEEGDAISPFYDPMIAKLVTHGACRDEARAKLARSCGALLCHPVRHNA